MTANYIKNRMPSRVIGMQTPHEVFFGHKAGIDHLRVWGADCVVHQPDATRDKLEKRGIHGIFVGYGTEHKGYRIAVPMEKGVSRLSILAMSISSRNLQRICSIRCLKHLPASLKVNLIRMNQKGKKIRSSLQSKFHPSSLLRRLFHQ